MPVRESSFANKARKWARDHHVHGVQAFSRFVMFTFLECLETVSNDFIFKGGNLLWLYIRTPRHTIDLDFATKSLSSVAELKSTIELACTKGKDNGIHFRLKTIKEIKKDPYRGASMSIAYQTDEGADNVFDIDVIFKLPTIYQAVLSPLGSKTRISGATVENIIVDKISTMARYRGGNTRMKDIDDIWRIMHSGISIDWDLVKKELEKQGNDLKIHKNWVNVETSEAWKRHVKRYKDLPESLEKVLTEIRKWLQSNF